MTIQVREYIDPTIGVATFDAMLTVMVGSELIEKMQEHQQNHIRILIHSLCTVTVMDADSVALSTVALHVYVPA